MHITSSLVLVTGNFWVLDNGFVQYVALLCQLISKQPINRSCLALLRTNTACCTPVKHLSCNNHGLNQRLKNLLCVCMPLKTLWTKIQTCDKNLATGMCSTNFISFMGIASQLKGLAAILSRALLQPRTALSAKFHWNWPKHFHSRSNRRKWWTNPAAYIGT